VLGQAERGRCERRVGTVEQLDRIGGVELGHLDEGDMIAVGPGLDHGARHQADEIAMSDEREGGEEGLRLDAVSGRRQAQRVEGEAQRRVGQRRRAGEDPFGVGEFGQRARVGQPMAGAQGQRHRHFEQRPGAQARRDLAARPRSDHEVERAVADARDRRVGQAADDTQPGLRIALEKGRDRRRDDQRRDRGRGADRHRRRLVAVHLRQLLLGAARLAGDELGAGAEGLAEGGQHGARGVAMDERHAALALELPYGLGDGGLRQPQPARGRPDAAGLGNGEELLDVPEIHR
jgi:hypothetical protein